jgi:hypothetical protein
MKLLTPPNKGPAYDTAERGTVREVVQVVNVYLGIVYVEQPFFNSGCMGIGVMG